MIDTPSTWRKPAAKMKSHSNGFFDEPSAGLDPISSRLLDDLILELRDNLGATVLIVTHELASIFTIGNNSVFLDAETRTITAGGDPKELLAHPLNPMIHRFLTRGKGNKYEHKSQSNPHRRLCHRRSGFNCDCDSSLRFGTAVSSD